MSTWASKSPKVYLDDGDLIPPVIEIVKTARGPFMDFTGLPIPAPRTEVEITWCEPLDAFHQDKV